MEIGSSINHLSIGEYEKIVSVLKRDRELRCLEEMRVRQLKQELVMLRRKGALKPGADPSRSCARCVNTLGRIINRGATCPLCFKKVCKACRQYGEDNGWICIFCHKQIELKAISGEWMHEFTRCSTRRHVRLPPGDQVRKVLYESHRKVKTVEIPVDEGRNCRKYNWTIAKERLIKPEKGQIEKKSSPTETLNADMPAKVNNASEEHIGEKNEMDHGVKPSSHPCDSLNTKVASHCSTSNINLSEETEANSIAISSTCTVAPQCLTRLNPWNGIEPEPTVPVRLPNAAPLGLIMQPECNDSWVPRERQSSDDGHSSMSVRSKSTSSEVLDENETAVSLSHKPYSPQRKQPEQKPETNGNRVSSIDTTDSGVCSPVLKRESSGIAQSSPRSLKASLEHDSDELEHNSSLLHSIQLGSDSSLSDSGEECQKPAIVFKKVTLRKRKFVPKNDSQDERSSTLSAGVWKKLKT